MTAAALAPPQSAPADDPAGPAPHPGWPAADGPVVLPLPAGLAAAVDALDAAPVHPVRVRHPRTGEVFRLVPESMAAPTVSPVPGAPAIAAAPAEDAPGVGRPFTPAEKAEYDGGESDTDAILAGIAEADAGLFVTDTEIHAAMVAEFPFLRDLPVPDGGDPGEPAAGAGEGGATDAG